jgi:DNA-binding response OmpR family regulator
MNAYGLTRDHTAAVEVREQYRKRLLIIDDDPDVTVTFKVGIEDTNNVDNDKKKIAVDTSNDPLAVLSDFKPFSYDLILIDICLPHMNGFQLCEKILAIDINVKICFMSSGEINHEALMEIYTSISLGCFIRKPVTIDYLVNKIRSELD